LADKPKTPAPPRKVQAPQRRSTTKPGGGDRNIPMFAILVGVGALVALAAVAFVTMRGGSNNDAGVASAMKAAGCTIKSAPAHAYKNTGQVHVPDGTKINYDTYPPSGGPHYSTPAIWDFYSQPVEPRLLVHNQEHGGVIVWWGTKVPASTVQKIRSFYDSSPISMVGTPLASLGSKVAITAWTGDPAKYGSEADYYGTGHAAVCPTFSQKAFKTFRDAYRGKGPEGIPMGSNQPGT
jgi:hypothetical protein